MKPSMIAQRSANAQAQILAAVTKLAVGVELDASGLAVTNHDPAIQAMLRWEALAALLATLLEPGNPISRTSAAPVDPTPAKPTKKEKAHEI